MSMDSVEPREGPPGTPLQVPGDRVERRGDGEWHLWVMAPGTRSQGRHGGLWVDGRWLEGEPGERRDGLVYRGSFADRSFPWSDSGWLPE